LRILPFGNTPDHRSLRFFRRMCSKIIGPGVAQAAGEIRMLKIENRNAEKRWGTWFQIGPLYLRLSATNRIVSALHPSSANACLSRVLLLFVSLFVTTQKPLAGIILGFTLVPELSNSCSLFAMYLRFLPSRDSRIPNLSGFWLQRLRTRHSCQVRDFGKWCNVVQSDVN